jgi:hypothetical protein
MRRIHKIRERALYPPRHLVSRISFVPPKGVRLDRHKNIVLNLTFFGVGCVGRIGKNTGIYSDLGPTMMKKFLENFPEFLICYPGYFFFFFVF